MIKISLIKTTIKKLFNTKSLLFLGLGLFAGFLILLRVFREEPPAPLPTPTPSPRPSPISSPFPAVGDPTYFKEIESANENFYPLLKYLPYETVDFKIRYRDPMVLEITLFGPEPEKSQEKAREWLISIKANLEKHRLNFVTP